MIIPEFNIEELIKILLDQVWHKKCEIIPNYMPPYPGKNTRPRVVVKYNDGSDYPPFLRYSKGPQQKFFWDMYGDDFLNVELAIIALSEAPYPPYVGPITFKLDL